MTQLFSSNNSNSALAEKRTFSGLSLQSNRQVGGSNSQVSQKIKNFFRINSLGSDSKDRKHSDDGHSTSKNDSKSSFRQSRFIPHITRNRSATVASEGNPLDDGVSPTAHANPYFIRSEERRVGKECPV